MRRIIDVLSIVGLITMPIAIGSVYSQTYASQSAAAKVAPTLEKFPLNQRRLIDFQTDTDGFKRLSDRQQLNQLRDWLLLTVVSSQGLSAKEINQSVYDLPTVRYGYMQPVANFEYGDTRSLYVGKGQVIALVPKVTTKEQRMDDLAHIADRHRKDIGKQPTSIIIFEYEIQSNKQSASLTQREALDAKKLFSSEYGYQEASIKGLDDLQRFMAQIDDVTFSQVKDANLLLGGRKIHARQYQGVRVEDIAVIWQSEQKIQAQLADFESRWNQKISALPASQQDQAIKQALEERQRLKLVNSSGFSLDPQYDYRSLSQILERAKPSLKALLANGQPAVSDSDIETVKLNLDQKNPVPYLQLVDRLEKGPRLLVDTGGSIEDLQDFLDAPEATSFQSARYDGDLKGTEVGMVLFYTDLLAKLWALNYIRSTPSNVIPDFTPLTKVQVSSIYNKEIEALPSTRLWFGSQDRGFQLANEGNSLLFARNATRIYAASSSPLKPGTETAAAANTDAFLSWWNDHYEEVARHEPQYERLNQIMKWSLLINWLNQANRNDLLGFLQPVSVKRDNWFPNWTRDQGDRLRFRQWQQVNFFNPGYKGSETEAMPLLSSENYERFGKVRYFRGGVSLASKSTFQGRRALSITDDLGELGLRSTLKYDSISLNQGKLSFTTLDETSYAFKNLDETLSSVTAQAKTGTKFRSPDAELANRAVSRNVSRTESGLQIDTAIGNTNFGTFSTAETQNGFVAGFRGRDMESGYSLFSKVSSDIRVIRDPEMIPTILQEIPDVQTILKTRTIPPDYFVKTVDSKQWVKATLEPQTGGGGGGFKPPTPPKDWQMMVGDLGDDSRNFRLGWIDDANVQKQLASGELESVYAAVPEESLGDTHGFADAWVSRKYKQTATKLVDDPLAFLQFKQKYLKVELKKVDRWLKAENNTKAAYHLDQLIELYGPEPNLILRRAVIKLRQGKLNAKLIFPKGIVDKANFLDEINGLLKQGKANFRRVETDEAFLYLQNDPGLNSRDWNLPLDQAIPFGSGARAYRLYPGEIGAVKLHLSGLGDTSTSFHNSTHFNGGNIANSLRNISTNESENCDDNTSQNGENNNNGNGKCPQDAQKQEKPVYVITIPEQG